MNKTWNMFDERARAEGQAIAEHNRLRIIPKLRPFKRRPDVTCLEVYVVTKNCEPSINLKKLAATEKHRAILARLRNPVLYTELRSS